ncbi:MAG: tetratricopeptide repeat protein [Deltaproteobacteria bacterium]|nr:tetratricopeptide repeat protein [Deltaproteobacteria bacterium]
MGWDETGNDFASLLTQEGISTTIGLKLSQPASERGFYPPSQKTTGLAVGLHFPYGTAIILFAGIRILKAFHSIRTWVVIPGLCVLLTLGAGCTVRHAIRDGFNSIKHNVKGNYYLEKKKYHEGLKVFQREVETNPESAEVHYFLGRYLLALEHPRKAFEHLDKAAHLKSDEPDYHFWLGVAASALKRADLERQCYEKALRLNPRHVQALTYLGHNYFEKREYHKALKIYSRAIDLRPENPSALFNRGLILKRLKRTPEEKTAWKQFLAYYPSGPKARQAVSYLNALGDFDYRNFIIGCRTVTIQKIRFVPFSAKIQSRSTPSLNLLGEIMNNNHGIGLHIVAYQLNNKELAERRAKSIKKYLVHHFPGISPDRLMVSWFDVPETIRIGRRVFKEPESIQFFTALPVKRKASSGKKGASRR